MFCYGKKGIITAGKKVLVLGDSITDFGQYLSVMEYYFIRFKSEDKPEFLNLGVSSETVSGLSEYQHPFPRPCVLCRVKKAIAVIKPEVVLVCYGINDGIYEPFSEENFIAFKEGYKQLIQVIKSFGAMAVVMTPPIFDGLSFGDTLCEDVPKEEYSYMHPYVNYDQVLAQYATYVMTELSEFADLTIDIYHPLQADVKNCRERDLAYCYGDGIHPSLPGHITIARTILGTLYNRQISHLEQWVENEMELFEQIHAKSEIIHNYWKESIGHDNPNKSEVFSKVDYEQQLIKLEKGIAKYLVDHKESPQLQAQWNGFEKRTFLFEGYEATIVMPKEKRQDKGWIWRAEFFGAFPSVDVEMVRRGFVLVHIDIANLYGGAKATALMGQFYDYVTKTYALAPKGILFGFSRGALYALSFALAWPDRTAALYLDAPVIDIESWPKGSGKGQGAPPQWEECKAIYGIEKAQVKEDFGWAKKRVEQLAKTKIPLAIVAGDCDDAVPYEENGERLAIAYHDCDNIFLEIIKPGVGHHPHSVEDPTEVADFLEEQMT